MTAAADLSLDTREAYQDAVRRAKEAAAAYYNSDTLLMDDRTYDTLVAAIAAAQDAHPEWGTGTDVTDTVAAGQGTGDVPHTVPMLSLDNVFDADELDNWARALVRRLGRPVTRYTVEPKMDGLALVARYTNGRLTRLLTRGDGTSGEDVTYAAGHIVGLPAKLTEPVTLEVRGEVLFTDAQYEAANQARLDHGDQPFVNARSGAAGALRGAKGRTYSIPLTFFAYGAVSLGQPLAGQDVDNADHSWLMDQVARLGISTTGTSDAGMGVCEDIDAVHEWVEDLQQRRPSLGFEVDGAVVKADTAADRADAGFSSRAPRWGIARKFAADNAFSTLEEVIWQIGRTGLITPRARITPVFVGGTTVTYATLHNPDDLARKGFLLGDTVSVVRAGEVIPRLEAPVVNLRTGAETLIPTPQVCPRCGGDIDRSQARWRCERGRKCGLAESIRYSASRDCWDIEGLGDKLVEQLVDKGLVCDVADLFTLTYDHLVDLDRMGPTAAANVLAEIEAAKDAPLARTVTALGIRGTGRSMSRRLAAAFGSMDALRAATAEELQTVDGIGPEKAPLIVEELAELGPVIDRLAELGVAMVDPDGASGPQELPLAGMTVVVTGSMTGALGALSRNKMNELIERAGGKASGSVSAKTSLVVAGEKAGSKLARAQTLGVQVTTPEEFADLVRTYLA